MHTGFLKYLHLCTVVKTIAAWKVDLEEAGGVHELRPNHHRYA